MSYEEEEGGSSSGAKAHTEESGPSIGSLQDFRLVKMMSQKTEVGPTTYRPRVNYSSKVPSAPKVSFGKQSRFLQSKSVFISHHHNADMMGTHSPGPIYWPARADKARPPALWWGEVMDPQKRQRREMLRSRGLMAEVGPAAYNPSTVAIKTTAPRPTFGKAARFDGLEPKKPEEEEAEASPEMVSPYEPINYHAAMKNVRPKMPSFTFGIDTEGRPAPFKTGKPLSTNRTTFITHSIQGGSAKSATFECNISPDQYMPKFNPPETFGWNFNRLMPHASANVSFGKSDRFPKGGTLFISSEHAKADVGYASPGPKYLYDGDSLGKARKERTGTLKWVP